MPDQHPPDTKRPAARPGRIRRLYHRIKALQGDPHYIAMGIAIGVFVGFTPTIPLHTIIALGLALLFRASKAGAAIGVWVGNPVTVPVFYFASFEIGQLILGRAVPLHGTAPGVMQLIRMGWDVALAMIVGGALLGLVPAVAAYFISFHLFHRLRARRMARKAMQTDAGDGLSSSGQGR